MRVLIGYDRLLGEQVTLGTRLGLAFLGTPERTDGKKFIPFHAEVRGAYWFSHDPFAGKGVRPYLFANAGLAQTSARLSTEVVDQTTGATKLDVYKTSGPGFAGAGIGVQYAVSPDAAMVIEWAAAHDPQLRTGDCTVTRVRLRDLAPCSCPPTLRSRSRVRSCLSTYRDELVDLVEYLPNIRRIEVKSRREADERSRARQRVARRRRNPGSRAGGAQREHVVLDGLRDLGRSGLELRVAHRDPFLHRSRQL